MDFREFLDEIYAAWAKTTGAENQYWMPEDNEIHGLDIWAVNEEQVKSPVASFVSDADSSFITAIHGALPDLVRRTHEALDEADRLDLQRDEQENRIAEVVGELDQARAFIKSLEKFSDTWESEKQDLLKEIRDLEDQVDMLNGEIFMERGW